MKLFAKVIVIWHLWKTASANTVRGVITDLRKIHPCKAERAQLSLFMAGGPGARLRAPGGVQGQRPGGGPGGEYPKLQGFYT